MTQGRKFYSLVLLGALLMDGGISLGKDLSEEIQVNYHHLVEVELSSKHSNRINFGNERVVKVIGATNKFSSLISEDGKNLFITTKVGAGEVITASVIMASSMVIDLKLKIVESKEPKLVEVSRVD